MRNLKLNKTTQRGNMLSILLNSCNENVNVNQSKRYFRFYLKSLGYTQLSINVFIKNLEVIVLKSIVLDTNKYDLNYLSITKDLHEKIKNKSIKIVIFERKTILSEVHERGYIKKVFSLTPTKITRNIENGCKRFIINKSISPENVMVNIYHEYQFAS
ncbi:hypothetical protein Sdiek1_0938 [Sulfurospirillum diekertiae]|uniref:Uncharacterized protein n=1 Tax=Sulfurospirillum diekertiae TaxID=1854492 RepID=A0A1Y0HL50_9BACT|nr:hypothetical protein [Sulfurospirillum diekertiae]ARU48104.1 hypothetical protein Sdiek1_0938 [Sulfurospirillum diekertiae]